MLGWHKAVAGDGGHRVSYGVRGAVQAFSFSYRGGQVGGSLEPRRAGEVWKYRKYPSK